MNSSLTYNKIALLQSSDTHTCSIKAQTFRLSFSLSKNENRKRMELNFVWITWYSFRAWNIEWMWPDWLDELFLTYFLMTYFGGSCAVIQEFMWQQSVSSPSPQHNWDSAAPTASAPVLQFLPHRHLRGGSDSEWVAFISWCWVLLAHKYECTLLAGAHLETGGISPPALFICTKLWGLSFFFIQNKVSRTEKDWLVSCVTELIPKRWFT